MIQKEYIMSKRTENQEYHREIADPKWCGSHLPPWAEDFVRQCLDEIDQRATKVLATKSLEFKAPFEALNRYDGHMDVVTLELFRDCHVDQYPLTSVYGLNVSDEILYDLLWARIIHINDLQIKINTNKFTPQSLLDIPRRNRTEDFNKLVDELKRFWQSDKE
jgi:hypothetical protein